MTQNQYAKALQLYKASRTAYRSHDLENACQLVEQAEQLCTESAVPADHVVSMNILHARVLRRLERYDEAMSVIWRARHLCKEYHFQESSLYIHLLAEHGMLFHSLQSYDDATKLLERALRLHGYIKLPVDVHSLSFGLALVHSYQMINEWQKAKALSEHVHSSGKKVLGENHPIVVQANTHLGVCNLALSIIQLASKKPKRSH